MKKYSFPLLLLSLNIGIILVAEFSGGGSFFKTSGLIHLMAIFFCLLSVYTIFRLRYLQGEVFSKIFQSLSAALLIFGLAHVIEYFMVISDLQNSWRQITDISVLVLYALSLVITYHGFEGVLKMRPHNKKRLMFLPAIALFFLAVIAFLVLAIDRDALAGYTLIVPMGLALFNITITLFLVTQNKEIAKIMPFLKQFISMLRYSLLLMALATIFELLEIMQVTLIPQIQITYLAHFALYAGISIQLLAFNKLSNLGGIYEDLRNASKQSK